MVLIYPSSSSSYLFSFNFDVCTYASVLYVLGKYPLYVLRQWHLVIREKISHYRDETCEKMWKMYKCVYRYNLLCMWSDDGRRAFRPEQKRTRLQRDFHQHNIVLHNVVWLGYRARRNGWTEKRRVIFYGFLRRTKIYNA